MGAGVVTGGGAHAGFGDGARDWAHPWQYALALCALLSPVPPALGWNPFMDGPVYLVVCAVVAGLVAVPLLLGRRRASFVRAAVVVGAVMVPWSVLGSLGGMMVFFMSAPLLWLAAVADPRRRPVFGAVAAGVGALLVAAMVAVPGFWWRQA
ncbi:hypothetical protein ACIPY6_22970 [Streptomyces sp. NPDC090054]|uniref:hypothetical protein n=1 Tax=Streptomyces sp. NPDC090054 TaxID=3365933 RepID=UPI00382B8B8A